MVRLGNCTAEAPRTRSKELLIKKFSDLRELCVSVVNTFSQNHFYTITDYKHNTAPPIILRGNIGGSNGIDAVRDGIFPRSYLPPIFGWIA